MKLLVTDGIDKKSLAVVRAIRDEVEEVGVLSRYPLSPGAASRYTARSHRVRATEPASYAAALGDVVEAYGYDHVLPVSGRTNEVVSRHRETLPVPVDRILPPPDSFRVANDKHASHEHAEASGVPVPASTRLASTADLARAVEDVGTPGVIKTGTETESQFVEYVDTLGELRAAYDRYRRTHESDPVYQERLPGRGRGFFGLYVDGSCRAHYAHRRVREWPPFGGASACAESLVDEALYDHADPLLSSLDWNGPVMVEFKEDAAGTPRFLEINPKLWGSLELGVRSGVNVPRALVRRLADEPVPALSVSPTRFHWPLSGDLYHAVHRPASAPAVLQDLVSPATRSNVELRDPLPHVLEFGKTTVSQLL
jgi:predicted ATP-grasp superfamily ATP-dependent carboligase